jgi:hypothetical protein
MTLHRVWVGQSELTAALRGGQIALEGPADLRQAFPEWLKLSVFVERGKEISLQSSLSQRG